MGQEGVAVRVPRPAAVPPLPAGGEPGAGAPVRVGPVQDLLLLLVVVVVVVVDVLSQRLAAPGPLLQTASRQRGPVEVKASQAGRVPGGPQAGLSRLQ